MKMNPSLELNMLWSITGAIISTYSSKTEQLFVVLLIQNNIPFKVSDYFAHPVNNSRVLNVQGSVRVTYLNRASDRDYLSFCMGINEK